MLLKKILGRNKFSLLFKNCLKYKSENISESYSAKGYYIPKEKTDQIYPKIRNYEKNLNIEELLKNYDEIVNLLNNSNFEDGLNKANILLNDVLLYNDNDLLYYTYVILGDIQFHRGEFISAFDKYNEALNYLSSITNRNENLIQNALRFLHYFILTCEETKNYNKGIEVINFMINENNFFEEFNDVIYSNILRLGKLNFELKKYDDALLIYGNLLEKLNKNLLVVDKEIINYFKHQLYLEIANALKFTNNNEHLRIIENYEKSLEFHNLIENEQNKLKNFELNTLYNISEEYNKLGYFNKSNNTLFICENLITIDFSNKGIWKIYNLFCINYLSLKNYSSFILYSLKIFEIIKNSFNFNLEENKEIQDKSLKTFDKVINIVIENWNIINKNEISKIHDLIIYLLEVDIFNTFNNEEEFKINFDKKLNLITKFIELTLNNQDKESIQFNKKLEEITKKIEIIKMLNIPQNFNLEEINKKLNKYLH